MAISVHAFFLEAPNRTDWVKKLIRMATCSNCGKHLPENGKVCPYCGAKRRNYFQMIFIAFLIHAAVSECAGFGKDKKNDKATTKTEQFIGNNPTNNNHQKSNKKSKRKGKKKSKKRRNRQSISFVTINEQSCFWAVIIP